MESIVELAIASARLLLAGAILLFPAWWLSGRLQDARASPCFRLLTAVGLGLVGYITGVNALGKVSGNSHAAFAGQMLLCVAVSVWILRRRPAEEYRLGGLISSCRSWIVPVA